MKGTAIYQVAQRLAAAKVKGRLFTRSQIGDFIKSSGPSPDAYASPVLASLLIAGRRKTLLRSQPPDPNT